jgi:hypothetical protein
MVSRTCFKYSSRKSEEIQNKYKTLKMVKEVYTGDHCILYFLACLKNFMKGKTYKSMNKNKTIQKRHYEL